MFGPFSAENLFGSFSQQPSEQVSGIQSLEIEDAPARGRRLRRSTDRGRSIPEEDIVVEPAMLLRKFCSAAGCCLLIGILLGRFALQNVGKSQAIVESPVDKTEYKGHVLVGDIGGPYNHLAVYLLADTMDIGKTKDEGTKTYKTIVPVCQSKTPREDIPDVTTWIKEFLTSEACKKQDVGKLVAGSLTVAGTVVNNEVLMGDAAREATASTRQSTLYYYKGAEAARHVAEASWTFKAESLEKFVPTKYFKLVNDYEARGEGLFTLKAEEDYQALNLEDQSNDRKVWAESHDRKVWAIMGVGEWLGEAFVTGVTVPPTATEGETVYRQSFGTEGGAAGFAPKTDLGLEILTEWRKPDTYCGKDKDGLDRLCKDKYNGLVYVSEIVSATGIIDIYEYLLNKFPEGEKRPSDAVIKCIEKNKCKDFPIGFGGKVAKDMRISKMATLNNGRNGDCQICSDTMDLFFAAWGNEAANVALKFLPFGGFYIGNVKGHEYMEDHKGQLKPRKDDTAHHTFMDCYLHRGDGPDDRLVKLLKQMPLYYTPKTDLGFRGGVRRATRLGRLAHGARQAGKGSEVAAVRTHAGSRPHGGGRP